MDFILTLSFVASYLSYTKAQFPIPGSFEPTSETILSPVSSTGPSVINPPSLQETFTAAYLVDLKSWADFDVVFNVNYAPAYAAVVNFNIIFERAIKSVMDPDIALSDATAVGRAIYETVAYLTPQTLPKILGYIYFDQLLYGNIINPANVLQLAESLSDTHKDIFSKPVATNIHGLFDAAKAFLTPFNLYNAKDLNVLDKIIVKYLYLVTGVPNPFQ